MEKKWFIGIDISKKTLDVVIYVPTKKHADETNYERFLNKEEGYKSLLCWLKKKNMAKKNYYAVKQGKVPGIYRTWDACKAQVHGYPGAIYKGFERLEEAEAFLGGGKMPEPLLRETIGTYFAAPERKAVQSTAAPDPSSLDWEQLLSLIHI